VPRETVSLSSGEMYHRKATDFVFGVSRRAKTKDGPVSIRDLHNLTPSDNTDNQASLRYAGHRVRPGWPRVSIRWDEVRSRRDPQTKEAATVSSRLSPSVTET
jgi:hypothetical protein